MVTGTEKQGRHYNFRRMTYSESIIQLILYPKLAYIVQLNLLVNYRQY